MKVVVYVEGSSDKAALNTLLAPLLDHKKRQGVSVDFFESPKGNKKVSVLTKVPKKAANIILNDPSSVVVAMPDLYPKNTGFPHETVDELVNGIMNNFDNALLAKHIKPDHRLKQRFKVFCFKHDFESLILAAEQTLKAYLRVQSFTTSWITPVEDQNHDRPPKRIVEALFDECGRKYQPVVDAPVILGASNYTLIADKCAQCFKPFIQFLTAIVPA